MSHPRRILVAERDNDTREKLAAALRAAGYATSEASTGREALEHIQLERPELALVGLCLQDIGGRDLARIFETNGDKIPVRTLVLAGPGVAPEDVAAAGGAPEKPVLRWTHVDQVVTRINSLFDLSDADDPERFCDKLMCGDVSIDPTTHSVSIDGRTVELTDREFRFLHILAVNRERACTRDELKELVWGDSSGVIGRTVDVLVSRLRSKLAEICPEELVSTVRGIGYRFTPAADEQKSL
ncbi:MAG: response regulator [Candidatus Eisenbacteria bacterium]|nr:response regulator [Candidatus Eisenbacteria bacterium]